MDKRSDFADKEKVCKIEKKQCKYFRSGECLAIKHEVDYASLAIFGKLYDNQCACVEKEPSKCIYRDMMDAKLKLN